MKFLKKFRKGQKGFTLIELLVVIAILGVIAAVAVPNILSFIGSGDEAAAQAEQHNLQVAVTAYMAYNSVASVAGADLGPTASGIAGAYLINPLSFEWTLRTDGSVIPRGTNPLPVP